MKFRQYSNGNKFIVFDSSDSVLAPQQVSTLLGANSLIESVIQTSSKSLQVSIKDADKLSRTECRDIITYLLNPIKDKRVRISKISELERHNPELHQYLRYLHQDNYDYYVARRPELVVSLYHFFLYDFVCSFKDVDMLWCAPFFKIGVFDAYGQFDAVRLIKDFERFKSVNLIKQNHQEAMNEQDYRPEP